MTKFLKQQDVYTQQELLNTVKQMTSKVLLEHIFPTLYEVLKQDYNFTNEQIKELSSKIKHKIKHKIINKF